MRWTFVPIGGSADEWTESLTANYTDGIVVLHRGCSSTSATSAR